MQIDFEDDNLRQLYEDPDFRVARFHPDLVKAYRRKVQVIVGAESELDLRALRSLHFEKLQGSREGQHSIRLNDQWRLILRIKTQRDDKVVAIIEIVDYH
ncbi:MAG: type II toxin-antitoxin system RelE/ParE family toxin [Microthrixaceae bacterium]|nr:type II toxin-antitoxin system RelE/ParE family toxin [Microthrixaceae bacterium]